MEEYAEQTESKELEAVHERSMEAFRLSQPCQYEHREAALNDRMFCFVRGSQWSGKWYEQFENKPKPEINKVLSSVLKHVNEYLNNRMTADFVPDDGDEADDLADTLDGLYRNDKSRGAAEEALDNAYIEGTTGGYGAWRLRACYEDEYDDEDERQKIVWEPIFDADKAVYFDSNAKKYDKSDAEKCWVLTAMSRSSFEKKYPDEDLTSWPNDVNTWDFDWITPDVVFIAEYYEVEMISDIVRVFETISGDEERYVDEDFELDPELETKLLYSGAEEIRQKKVKRKKVHKYIESGAGILEDCGYVAGTEIPVVPFYGMRFIIDGVEYCFGEVRHTRDPQMLKNANYAKIAEQSAYSGIEKPIFAPEQIEAPLDQEWRDDNIQNYPYLRAKPIYDANGNIVQNGPIGFTRSPQIPPATSALLQMTEMDMREIMGSDDQGEVVKSNVSGKAVELIQNKVSMKSFMPLSNIAKSEKRSAEIWLSMAKDLYVEKGRKMKTLGKQDESGSVELMKESMNDEGRAVLANNLKKAKHSITIEVGPSTATKRQAIVKDLIEMMRITQDPEDIKVLSATAFLNMQGEGLQDIREFYRNKLLRMGVVTPNEKEAEQLQIEMQNQQPDAQTEFLKSETAKNMAEAENTQADSAYKMVQAENKQADTLKTLAEIDRDERQNIAASTRLMQSAAQPGANQPVENQIGERWKS